MEFFAQIQNGMLDSELAVLADAIKSRQDAIKRQALANLIPGDRVRVTRCKPKVFNGFTGKVVDVSDQRYVRVEIDEQHLWWLDAHWRRYLDRDGKTFRAPKSILEVIDKGS